MRFEVPDPLRRERGPVNQNVRGDEIFLDVAAGSAADVDVPECVHGRSRSLHHRVSEHLLLAGLLAFRALNPAKKTENGLKRSGGRLADQN